MPSNNNRYLNLCSLMNGLFNEVMSSAINRSSEFQNLDEAVILAKLN
jgi:hypothetical protein